jgi:hypothetical protein
MFFTSGAPGFVAGTYGAAFQHGLEFFQYVSGVGYSGFFFGWLGAWISIPTCAES